MESSWKSRIEILQPGTTEWALRGVGFAALFALPTAALIGGLIGLLTPGPVHEGRFQNW